MKTLTQRHLSSHLSHQPISSQRLSLLLILSALSCPLSSLSAPQQALAQPREAQQSAAQAQEDQAQRDKRSLDMWEELHKELLSLGESLSAQEGLPESSLLHPLRLDKKKNQKTIDNLTSRLMQDLGSSPLEPLLKRRLKMLEELKELGAEVVTLEEKLIGAPDKGGFFEKSKADIQALIERKKEEIETKKRDYQGLLVEFRLSFEAMGLKLSQQQVKDLFSVISGETMRGFFVQFSNLKLLSQVIASLIKSDASDSYSSQAKRYYAIYVALIYMLMEAHESTYNTLRDVHVPRVKELMGKTSQQIANTERLMSDPKASSQREIYEQNLKVQKGLYSAAQNYERYLLSQAAQMKRAQNELLERFKAVLNTYQTVSLSTSLLSSIRAGVDDINKLQELSLPELLPLSSEKLHEEFVLITNELNASPVSEAMKR